MYICKEPCVVETPRTDVREVNNGSLLEQTLISKADAIIRIRSLNLNGQTIYMRLTEGCKFHKSNQNKIAFILARRVARDRGYLSVASSSPIEGPRCFLEQHSRLVGSRNGFERDLHKQKIACFTIELK